MTEILPSEDAEAGTAEGHEALRVNIRLHRSVHGPLFGEFARISRGFRNARAIQLMTIGLMHESGGSPSVHATSNPPVHGPETQGNTSSGDENRLFVSAVLESCAEGP